MNSMTGQKLKPEHTNRRDAASCISALFLIFFALSALMFAGCGAEGGRYEAGATSETEVIPAIKYLTLRTTSYELTANGRTQISLSAYAEDKDRNAVTGTERIDFTVTSDPDKTYYEYYDGWGYTVSGVASTTLPSPKMPVESLPHIFTVQAKAKNGVTGTLDIRLSAGQIGVMADPVSVIAGDYGEYSESTITAIVSDMNGAPVSGEYVSFAVMSGTGRFKSYYSDERIARAATGSDGKASVIFLASGTGEAKIKAWVDASVPTVRSGEISASEVAYQSATATVTVFSVKDQNEEVGTVSLTADPPLMAAGGTNSAVLTAVIKNSAGAAVAKGTTVIFSTTLGKFANGEQLYSTETPDANGTVSVPLIAGTVPGTAEITCFARGVTQKVTVKLTGTSDSPGAASITLSAFQASAPADGASSISITATVLDSSNNPVAQGTAVNFSTDMGRFPGNKNTYSTETPSDTGTVTVSLIAPDTPGKAQVTCFAGGVSQNISVTFTGKGADVIPAVISLAANPTSISANGSSSAAITAVVKDLSGNPVPEGTEIRFSTTKGKLSDTTVKTPNDAGTVTVSLMSETTVGIAEVTVSAGNVSQTLSVEFSGGSSPAATVSLRADPDRIQIGGSAISVIDAFVRDRSGNPVAKGASVIFTTTAGRFSNGKMSMELATTDNTGNVTVMLSSGSTAETARVTVNCGSASSSISIDFVSTVSAAVSAAVILSTPSPADIPADGSSSSVITAEIRDLAGAAMPKGTSLTFTTTAGHFRNNSTSYTVQTPDDSGKVTVSLIAGTSPATAEVRCEAGGVSQKVTVTFTGSTAQSIPASIVISTPAPASIPADGASSSAITVSVKDMGGNSVSRGTGVTFSTTAGKFPNGSQTYSVSTPDDTGTVTVSLIAGTATGIAEIKVSSGNVSQKTTVEFTGGAAETVPASIVIAAPVPAGIPADGASSSVIAATVKDVSGKPVTRGTGVTFSTTAGKFANGNQTYTVSTPDDTGTVTVSLIAGAEPAIAEIIVSAGNVSQKTTVEFTGGASQVTVGSIVIATPNPATISVGGFSSVIAVSVKDVSGKAVPKATPVNFSTTLGKFASGNQSYTLSTADDSGNLSVSLISENTAGTASVTVSAGNISQKVFVEITSSGGDLTPARLAVSTSKTVIKSDNSEKAEITATALDINNAALPGVNVHFSADGGQLSVASVKTGTDGTAKAEFSSGTIQKENRTVFVTVTAGNLSRSIPVKISGTTVEISADKTDLGKANLTITVKDAGGNAVYQAPVTLKSVDKEDSVTENTMLRWELATGYANYLTDVNGELKIIIRGNTEKGSAVLRAESLGAVLTQTFTISSVGEEFRISALYVSDGRQPSPEEKLVTLNTGQELLITVSAQGRQKVRFATTFGTWKENGARTLSVAVNNGKASATLAATQAGMATVQASDEASADVSDTLQVAISAPVADAAKIALQVTPAVLSPSTGGELFTADLIATVKNRNDQVVGGAPVIFSLENTTGGGEYIKPVYVLTDSSGTAKAVFTSGSLSSGAGGVKIRAAVADRSDIASSVVTVVIGKTAGSVQIGTSSRVSTVNSNTAYQLPMSVLVSDANGNPVANAQVSLGLWPVTYATGYWSKCSDGSGTCPYHIARISNEDKNRNLILDAGEDINDDGMLTPPNSAAGSIPATVTTDENGIAEFNLVYQKRSAVWIEDEITASVIVSGTETRSSYRLWLSYLEGEEDNLPHSPYNSNDDWLEPASVSVTAYPQNLTADSVSKSEIKASVYDWNGTLMEKNVKLVFTTTAGKFAESGSTRAEVTTTAGIATATLVSSDYAGTATVTVTVAENEDVFGAATVTFAPGAPAQRWSTVTAVPSNLTADGTSTSAISVRAADANGNTVSDGTLLVFDLDQGMGSLSSRTVQTQDGQAGVIYTSGKTQGTATITVRSGDNTYLGSVQIRLIGATVKTVTISKGADKITADGVSSTRITATVKDAAGASVKDGTIVSFVTSAGTFGGGCNQRSDCTAATADGNAFVDLVSSTSLGTATVTATAGGVSANTTVQFVAGSVASFGIALTATPDSLFADGKTTSKIRALVKDAKGNPVSGEVLTFTVTGAGGVLSAQSATTADGVAEVTYTASETAGYVTVTAKAANGAVGTVTLVLAPTDIGGISVTANPEEITANGVSTSQITALVVDEKGNPVADAPVVFKDVTDVNPAVPLPANNTYKGTGPSVTTVFYSRGGSTKFTLSHTGSKLTVYMRNDAVGSRELLETSSGSFVDRIRTKDLDVGTYYLEIQEGDGNWEIKVEGNVEAVPEGNPVKLADTVTDGNGKAYYTYTSTKVKRIVIIRAECGSLNKSVNVYQIAGTAVSIELLAEPETLYANGENKSTVLANVFDVNNNLVGDGVTVTFSTDLGTLSENTAETEDGVAKVSLISPIASDGKSATVTGTMGGKSAQVEVELTDIYLSDMSATPSAIFANGTDISTIRVRLKRKDNGIAIAGETVVFSTSGGTLKSQSVITNEDGIAEVGLIAPTQSGSATVIARYGEIAPTQISVTFKMPEKPQIASITLSADPATLPADKGISKSTITAVLTLMGGGYAPDDTAVKFTIVRGGGSFGESGTVTTDAYTVGNGAAFTLLYSGDAPGIAVIRAESGVRTAEIEVVFTSGSVGLVIIPNSILGTGEEKAELTASLKEVDGSAAPAGTAVKFVLADTSMGSIVNEKNIAQDTFYTDARGEAKAWFRGAAKGCDAKITAVWEHPEGSVSGSGTVTIQSPPVFMNVAEGYPDPASVNIRGTGGQSTSLIVFEVKDSVGNAVDDGYRVDFEIFSGPGGGEDLSPVFALTSDGKVSAVLRSGTKPGPVSIRAAYFYDSNVSTTASQIAIVAGPPVGEAFGVSARYVNISGLWKFQLQDTITVSASDATGTSIPDNTAISFKTYDTGGLFNPGMARTEKGFATNILYSVPEPVPMQGFVSVTAEAVNGGRTTHVTSLSVVRETDFNQILYAGTNGGGVYKSLNSGATWENISRSSAIQGQNWIGPYVNDVAADPDNPNVVYAGTGFLGQGNVYRSLNGGMSWNSNNTEEWNGVFGTDGAVLSLLCDDDGCDDSFCNSDICATPEGEEIPCYRYVWIGTKGNGVYFAPDGQNFQWGGIVSTPEPSPDNSGDGTMTLPRLSASSRTEKWFVTYQCSPISGSDSELCNWQVQGTVSGIQNQNAENGTAYTSDNEEVSFRIYQKTREFVQGDSFSFDVTASGLGYGTEVLDLVKVKGTHGATAVLYAATGAGIYKSDNGGITWNRCGFFTGDYINTLALWSGTGGRENDIIYAGTKEAGVWVSTDSGVSWTAHNQGLGRGLSASVPKAAKTNRGAAVFSKVEVYEDCISENWTLTCTGEATDTQGAIFKVTGSVSGPQADYMLTDPGTAYTIPNVLSFTISNVSRAFSAGGKPDKTEADVFTFTTTRDSGRHIRSLLADPAHQLIYAATYFTASSEPHPVGNIYVHDLEPNGYMTFGEWRQANLSLPQYDPPDDKTLFAQHVLATDNPENPQALFAGGEGINLYKAVQGLDTGMPVWEESKSGLSNLIMARMPVLFSGVCEYKYATEILESYTNGSRLERHTVYIQDQNGNPPVSGTSFKVYIKDAEGKELATVKTYKYSDLYTYTGTWRNPADAATNNPFVYEVLLGAGERVVHEYTPYCRDTVPGCASGN